MAHCIVPAAEKILDTQFPVLDKGYVSLIDYMGSDERIAQAARVSFGQGTRTARTDKALIDYLLKNNHTSPFEQVVLTFIVKLPLFVARQWIRHRTARTNEISARYSVLEDDFYLPDAKNIGLQSTDNRQGRYPDTIPPDEAEALRASMESSQASAYSEYQNLIDKNVAREIARINLPQSIYTRLFWQMDLHNLFHFLMLRMDSHAQLEIREYATAIFDITRTVVPDACSSFEEHVLKGVSFSASEMQELKRRLACGPHQADIGTPLIGGKVLDSFEHKLGINDTIKD